MMKTFHSLAALLILPSISPILWAGEVSSDQLIVKKFSETPVTKIAEQFSPPKGVPSGAIFSSSPLSQVEASIFHDLVFPQKLISKEFQVSDHESILFKESEIEAKAYGSTLTLNLQNQKLTSLTFVGYVLGPFYPAHDYLNTYFPTLLALQKLIARIKTSPLSEKAVKGLEPEIDQAVRILKVFEEKASHVKKNKEEEYQQNRIVQALENLYGGQLPENRGIEITRLSGDKKETGDWQAVLQLSKEKIPGKIQNRLIRFEERPEGFLALEIQDRDFKNEIQVRETFTYAQKRSLTHHLMESFHTNEKLKMSSLVIYDDGMKTNRYYNQYDDSGARIRHVNETYYGNGELKASSDFRYTSGKRYFQKFSLAGKKLLSSSLNLI